MAKMNKSNEKDEVVQRYVDLLTNAGFKAVFGDRKNKEVVMSILNTLLPPHRKLKDIRYLPTENQGPTLKNKEFRYDFMCTGEDDTVFIVETQCYNDYWWFRRCVSYASRMYNMQNHRGKGYDVAPVYLIGLMGIDIFDRDEDIWKDRYISEYTFREKETHDLLDETIIIIFAEIARFNKNGDDCMTDIDRMCYLLKNSAKLYTESLRNQPEWLKQEVFVQILKACEIARFDKKKRIQYDKDMYDERRFYSELYTARREGMDEGMEKGIEKGRAEGKAEGIIETARNLLALGVDIETVSKATGLDIGEIETLSH